MRVRSPEAASAFLEAAGSLLLADEARHNLVLGLAGTLRDHPELYPDHAFWLVEREGEAVAAALRTRPLNLVLARPRLEDALAPLASSVDDDLPGVVGALPEVERFAASWCERTGARTRLRHAQGIYALERVEPVTDVPGRMRDAAPDDGPLLADWMHAFGVEALGEERPDRERIARMVEHRLAGRGAGFVLWEDGSRPVSLAGFGGATPSGIRVGPVYTPPELRGRGYASALVAELSERLLASGRRFCFLYTDLANPTSNRIYERIGYRRVCESAELAFER